VNKKEKAVSIV